MDRLPYRRPPRWWGPRLSPFWMAVIRPARLVRTRRREGVAEVRVQGLEHVRGALERGCGVLITSKHTGHADPFVLLRASDRLGTPFCYLAGWQVFQLLGPVARWVIQRHGCFSIDREGRDVRAFRQAVDIVHGGRNPLVIFAEGEVYHNCDWVAPFRRGAAAIALAAAERGGRPVVGIPAAIRYEHCRDPLPALSRVMDAVERRLLWQPRPDLLLAERVPRAARGVLALRELEYLGAVRPGPFPVRVEAVTEAILRPLEARYGVRRPEEDTPARVTELRRRVIRAAEGWPADDPRQARGRHDLADLEVTVQLYSYAHDYDEQPLSLDRLAEIVDKFEEDVLGAPTATVRGGRRATVAFGPPVDVPGGGKKEACRALTDALEQGVRELVQGLRTAGCPATAPSGLSAGANGQPDLTAGTPR